MVTTSTSADADENVCEEKWVVDSYVGKLEKGDDVTARVEWVALREEQKPGTTLLRVRRTASSIVDSPKWNTLQVGASSHARFGAKALKINHSSDPSTRMLIGDIEIDVVSTRIIPAGEALSFNYNTTEWEMDEPFVDWDTGLNVQGFSNASAEEQQRLLKENLVAPHIRELAAKHGLL